MSKNVSINNTSYKGVSKIQLTTTSGEEASFQDVDEIIVPSGELEITSNGTYDASLYATVNINVPTEGIPVIINTETTTTIELANNTEYRRDIIESLILTLPENIPTAFECQVCFTSGVTATTITMPDGIIIKGDDVKLGVFTPAANNRYNLLFWYDGVLTWCAVYSNEVSENVPEITGEGTEASPYMITTASQLKVLSDEVDAGDDKSGKYYALGADIDLSAYSTWNPIGANDKTSDDANTGFAGTFDGRGHVIKNLNVSGVQYAGLFGSYLTGVIMNLGLESGEINTSVSNSTCGAIARKATADTAKIINCYSRVPCTAIARSSGLVDELVSGAMLVGCYQAAKVNNGAGYAIKAATTDTGDIHYCLWDKTLTTNGYTSTTNATNNSGLTTVEFATAASTLNTNLSAVAEIAGIDVSKLCSWTNGADGYPRLVVAA